MEKDSIDYNNTDNECSDFIAGLLTDKHKDKKNIILRLKELTETTIYCTV